MGSLFGRNWFRRCWNSLKVLGTVRWAELTASGKPLSGLSWTDTLVDFKFWIVYSIQLCWIPRPIPILNLKKAHNHLSGMLSPYRLYSVSPPEIQSVSTRPWAIPVFKNCATTHQVYRLKSSLSQNLTYSEHLLLKSTKSVSKEICRVIVEMWERYGT
jgi:hypothetical protein